ncbi:MAG TPA: ABC transporter permease [Gemmatimonadaceae bacterium]|jgi:simple sugar transport system permease protein
MNAGLVSAFAEATIRTATPLLLAASGELIIERAGLINIGLEGVVLGGAFGALLGATHGGTAFGYAVAAASGLFVMLVFAFATLGMGADQIITGTAITLLALGATGTLYRTLYGAGGAALSIATSAPIPVPLLAKVPVIGSALFAQPAVTYFAYAVVPMTWWWLTNTHAGLALRAIGENPAAAIAAGISVRRYRLAATVVAGVLGGIAGGVLVLAQAGTFVEGMSAGRGFIAIAIVVLGRWNPIGVGLAALLFAATTSLQYLAQATGLDIPYQLVLALPYVLTLAALAGIGGRAAPPATLARVE